MCCREVHHLTVHWLCVCVCERESRTRINLRNTYVRLLVACFRQVGSLLLPHMQTAAS